VAFRDGGGRLAVGEDSDEVLRIGEEEREIRHRAERVESEGGGAHRERADGGAVAPIQEALVVLRSGGLDKK
jgi:hypothetical protein